MISCSVFEVGLHRIDRDGAFDGKCHGIAEKTRVEHSLAHECDGVSSILGNEGIQLI